MNLTHAYLLASRPLSTMAFSGVVSNQSVYLNGSGGQAGNGFPLPRRGYITALQVWDGTTLRFENEQLQFQAGDRIAVYCQAAGSDFAVKIRLNGNSTALQVTGVPFNSTLYATVELMLIRE